VESHSTVEPYSHQRIDIPYYGPNKRPPDTVADFLFGGNRKRLIIEHMASDDGWTAAALVTKLRIGRATVFEVIRALNAAGALDQLPDAHYRLSKTKPLGRALRKLTDALRAAGDDKVARPPRPTRPRQSSSRRPRRRRRRH
jgi:hypothetical protein